MLEEKGHQSSPQACGKRLRIVRKMSGLTLKELANKYQLSVSTIKYWESAKNQGLSPKGAKKIISAMQNQGVQCSYMWLMHGIGLQPQFLDINASDSTNKNTSYINQTTYEEEKSISHEITMFCEKVNGAITITVYDDGMEPIYSIGDGVGGKRLYGQEIAKAIGKNCIVETEDHQILCRRVANGKEDGNFNLYCVNPYSAANPPNIYDVKILSAAPISRVWKRIVMH